MLKNTFSELFGGGRSQEVPPELREALGLGDKPSTKGETPKVLSFLEEMNRKVGKSLLGLLTAETEIEVLQSKAAAERESFIKEQLAHCTRHKETERKLQIRLHEIESKFYELQDDLERARQRLSATDRRNGQFSALLSEIVAAVGAGKPLTVNVVADGISRAETRGFTGPTYLVFPAPPKPTAEAAAPAPESAPATAGKTSTTGAG